MSKHPRRRTRAVRAGTATIGADHPVVLQSMCATKTTDVEATVAQVEMLQRAGAEIVRVAVDHRKDAAALVEIRQRTSANLSVDLQENYRLAEVVAPHVEKLRYNPGHLYHVDRETPWRDKVRYLADVAAKHDCALRVGVNCGSVDPAQLAKFPAGDKIGPMLASAAENAQWLDEIGFARYCVSLKDSNPWLVVEVNERFAAEMPDVPLHLGVTEAGMPPEGIIKTQLAVQELLRAGIGETLRVSLTVPSDRKHEEIEAGRKILDDVREGRRLPRNAWRPDRLNIISCPSCARVQNKDFVALAEQLRESTRELGDLPLTIAVMGCRVNGPGETDDADLGLWCGPNFVNLKRRGHLIGQFSMDEILPRVREELDRMIDQRPSQRPDHGG